MPSADPRRPAAQENPKAKEALLALDGGAASVVALLASGRSFESHFHTGRCLVHLAHEFPDGKREVVDMLMQALRWPNRVAFRVPRFASDEGLTKKQLAVNDAGQHRTLGCSRLFNVLGTLAAIELEPLRLRILFEITPQEEDLTSPRSAKAPTPRDERQRRAVKKPPVRNKGAGRDIKLPYTSWPPPKGPDDV